MRCCTASYGSPLSSAIERSPWQVAGPTGISSRDSSGFASCDSNLAAPISMKTSTDQPSSKRYPRRSGASMATSTSGVKKTRVSRRSPHHERKAVASNDGLGENSVCRIGPWASMGRPYVRPWRRNGAPQNAGCVALGADEGRLASGTVTRWVGMDDWLQRGAGLCACLGSRGSSDQRSSCSGSGTRPSHRTAPNFGSLPQIAGFGTRPTPRRPRSLRSATHATRDSAESPTDGLWRQSWSFQRQELTPEARRHASAEAPSPAGRFRRCRAGR